MDQLPPPRELTNPLYEEPIGKVERLGKLRDSVHHARHSEGLLSYATTRHPMTLPSFRLPSPACLSSGLVGRLYHKTLINRELEVKEELQEDASIKTAVRVADKASPGRWALLQGFCSHLHLPLGHSTEEESKSEEVDRPKSRKSNRNK
ncbi:hypothetical protein Salat_2969800 [Sesamum alatum]|uniref:Uncharacterized protein n=1 Tax=Sesamum alatum TaxID=300844 RepID=A0AAE2C7Q9_9LAMI|nr:hypothetical protein Salat_2969800 [Sesamum alatum]